MALSETPSKNYHRILEVKHSFNVGAGLSTNIPDIAIIVRDEQKDKGNIPIVANQYSSTSYEAFCMATKVKSYYSLRRYTLPCALVMAT